jgi:hypothetical protein
MSGVEGSRILKASLFFPVNFSLLLVWLLVNLAESCSMNENITKHISPPCRVTEP